jgi:glycosyltransferase involved in cell wall biosynthesis
MKIAIVSPIMVPVPPLKYGGIQLVVAELAKGLAKRGHMVTVFCSGQSTIEGENITRVETSPYPTSGHADENRDWEKKQLFEVVERQAEFDVIHLNYEPVVLEFEIDNEKVDLLRLFSVPTVLTFHNSTNIPEHIEYYKNHPLPDRCTPVFISENHRSPLSFIPNSEVIYNGIDVERFPFGEDRENYLLFLGRITPSKGILEAISVSEKTRVPLIIAANINSSDKDFYEKEVRLRIDGHLIRYVGEVDFSQKTSYLKKARCLLFPILWDEPFGLVMVEALACGTPVIAFRRGSVPEIIRNGENGYIVEDIHGMISALGMIHTISARKCRESIVSRFSVDEMVSRYEAVFLRA